MIAHTEIEREFESYQLEPGPWKKGLVGTALVALGGWAASVAGWAADSRQFHFSYLTGFVFFAAIVLGSLFFVMVQHMTGSAWSVTVRRLMETVMSTMPVVALLFIPLAFGMHDLYPWARPAALARDAVLAGKAGYLNERFFLLRSGAYFAIWSLWCTRLYRLSVGQDHSGDTLATRAMARWSAPGLLLAVVTTTLASFDWVMSLDAHWYSTIFGLYVYSGGVLAFFAALVLICLALRWAGVLQQSVNIEHYHDLGKWLFALTIFWAYIAFSQYLLIWYANIPEETVWFRQRLIGSWRGVAALLLFGHFMVPFIVLLTRAAKRNLAVLGLMAGWILVMSYADVYWLVMPVLHPGGIALSWMDPAALAAIGGTLGFAFWWRLGRAALVPAGDPRLDQCLEFENV